MSKRTRILVVDSDLHTLSKIYLSLIHKNYKVEASNDAQEIMARTERFKPHLIILHSATKNLTPAICKDLSKKRIQVLVIADREEDIFLESWRWEVIQMPADVGFFDTKIREVLHLVE